MISQTASEVSRLNRLERRAQAYFHIGRSKSNLGRLVRATRLETAANARMLKMITAEIEAYAPAPAPRSSV
jgi:hypothetical protein